MKYYYYKRAEQGGYIYEKRTFPSLLGEEITEEEYNLAVPPSQNEFDEEELEEEDI